MEKSNLILKIFKRNAQDTEYLGLIEYKFKMRKRIRKLPKHPLPWGREEE